MAPRIQSFPVRHELRDFVQSITLSPESAGESHSVVPGPCAVFGFQLSGSMQVARESGWRLLSSTGLTGLCTGPRVFHQAPSTRTVLIRLAPWAVPVLFQVRARELTDGHESLADILPESNDRSISWLGERPEDAVESVQNFLIERARRAKRPASSVAVEGVRIITQRSGNLRMQELEAALGWSRRHVERIFLDMVGISPKAFAAIVRFRRAERALREGKALPDVALDHGYYDQSHLANEVRRFSGQTPTALLR